MDKNWHIPPKKLTLKRRISLTRMYHHAFNLNWWSSWKLSAEGPAESREW